ncbi:hypothetical protein EIP86_003414 [Pleurotus ostreatoroseus]|nr:hypothetical protein EIP86_003414 [Pleurotus ostreatoroseus]
MTLGEDLMKLSISGPKQADPVANASKQGKVPTLGEVKRSLKVERRFATFKLFYYDHTPDDYEPPHFRAGDSRKDKWFFTTHDRQEVPEKCSIGQIQTGWHGVDLHVSSIAGYIPSSEDNSAPFCGITTKGGHAAPLTPAEEAVHRLQQIEVQKEDAERRKVVWDAEGGLGSIETDADADGEIEEDNQVLEVWRTCTAGMEYVGPIGIRDGDGNIVSLSHEKSNPTTQAPSSAEALFQGVKEKIPHHIGQLVRPSSLFSAATELHITRQECPTGAMDCTQTQRIDCPGTRNSPFVPDSPLSSSLPSPSPSPSPTPQPNRCRMTTRSKRKAIISPTQTTADSVLPPSDPIESSEPSQAAIDATQRCPSPDTGLMRGASMKNPAASLAREDTEMLDMNTQLPGYAVEDGASQPLSAHPSMDAVVACECGVSNWDLIMVHDLHPRMMAKFRDLALFRRAIKVCETCNPESLSAFTKLIGFIALESKEQDDLGIMETNTRASKSKNKKGSKSKQARRKTMQKSRYIFVREIKKTQEYKDYFNPNPEVEKRILGLDDLACYFKPTKKSNHNHASKARNTVTDSAEVVPETPSFSQHDDVEMVIPAPDPIDGSQTQAETQLMLETQEEDMDVDDSELKRKTTDSSDDDGRKTKKIKISIGPAVDLGD